MLLFFIEEGKLRKMNDLFLTTNTFEMNGYYTEGVGIFKHFSEKTIYDMCAIFDQNGYKMTEVEKVFCDHNFPEKAKDYRNSSELSWHVPWMTQEFKREGAILNHCWLFERKGFADEAYKELAELCEKYPILYKVLKIRPKWGLDFSMDWVDREGNVFELVHWEWDTFEFNDIIRKKQQAERIIRKIDFDKQAKKLIETKNDWHLMPFKEQSDYKCESVGLSSERFNDVIWE